MSADGTEETDLQFKRGRVSHLVGYHDRIMAEVDGVAWTGISSFAQIRPEEVLGGAAAGNPTAPFYLY